MEIKIKMLDVKDGDAIIVYLFDTNRNYLILIDGGRKSYARNVIAALIPFLEQAKKTAPDLIICTHYDSDHIGGLLAIVKNFLDEGHRPGQVWIHTPGMSLKKTFQVVNECVRASQQEKPRDFATWLKLEEYKEPFELAGTLLIESYVEMSSFIEFLEKNDIEFNEPFAQERRIDKWPEIEILGPTPEYYTTLFGESNTPIMILKEETEEEAIGRMDEEFNPLTDPCAELDKAKRPISSTNRASVILLITVEGRKYLFTGDAGTESMDRIPKKEKLKDIFWLKVPHHGSCNNLSSEWIKILAPQFAFVSGHKRVNRNVIECLQCNKTQVFVTRDMQDIDWPLVTK